MGEDIYLYRRKT